MTMTMTAEMMKALKSVHNIQGETSNPNKSKVRYAIRQQVEPFTKQQGKLSMLSLPSTEWLIELELSEINKKNNTPFSIIGLENNPKLFQMVKANMPKGNRFGSFEVFCEDFEKRYYQGLDINVFWADYCACFKKGLANGFAQRYPLIQAFLTEVTNRKSKFLYYMTFSLNGRIDGGREGKTTLQFAQELKNVIGSACKNLPVIPILSIIYKGAKGKDGRGRQTMITLGFAVNMGKGKDGQFWSSLNKLPASIPFKPFKAKWMKDESESTSNVNVKKEVVKTSQVTTSDNAKSLRKLAIKALYNAKIPNADIAKLLNLSRHEVGANLSHILHPESFRK